jgi:hypothetical protein
MGRPDPRTSSRLAGILLAAVVLSGCQSQVGAVEPSAMDVTATPAPLPAVEPVGTSVPNVIGLVLDVAKPRLQEAGFSGLSEDLLHDRSQIVENNWRVCTQEPPASGTLVELGVVKTQETCPGTTTTTTSALPSVADPTTRTAVAKPKPAPQPALAQPSRTSAKPSAKSSPPSSKKSSTSSKASERSSASGSGSSVGTVHPGAFCDPPGSGVSKTGKPMVCGPASDGRNRWKSA